MIDSTLLLTGGTGVMGWRLARRFSQAGYGVPLLVRKASRKGLRDRITAFRAEAPAAAAAAAKIERNERANGCQLTF